MSEDKYIQVPESWLKQLALHADHANAVIQASELPVGLSVAIVVGFAQSARTLLDRSGKEVK